MEKSNKSTACTFKSEVSVSWRVANDKKLKIFHEKLITICIYFLPFYLNDKPLRELRKSYKEFVEKIKEEQNFLSEYEFCKEGASLESRSSGTEARKCLECLKDLVKIVSQDNIESSEFRKKYEEFNVVASKIKYPS